MSKFDKRNKRKRDMASWDGMWGKSSKKQNDPHKDNPEPVRGGCGNPGCDICYQSNGQLKNDDGRIQTSDEVIGEVIGEDFSRASEAMMRMAAESMVRSSAMEAMRMDMRRGGYYLGTFNSSTPPPSETPEQEKKRRALAKLDQLRDSVKEYLLADSMPVDWDDVVGNETARTELQEAIEASVTHAEVYSYYGMKPPKGVMLWGPPGCGKTMLAKASATAVSRIFGAESQLLVINGAELEAPVVGIAAQRVKALFAYASAYKDAHGVPLTIFIDEADAVLKLRESAPWTAELVGTLLGEMDGLRESGAFIILATNRPDELDQALLREGRIDRKIRVTRPSQQNAVKIMQNQLREAPPWLHSVDVESVVEMLFDPLKTLQVLTHPESKRDHHFTLAHIVNGSMITGLLARAKSRAFRRDVASGTVSGVTQTDFAAAVDAVFEENKGLDHSYALLEFVKDVALPAEMARKLN